jgi:hypothetical protein
MPNFGVHFKRGFYVTFVNFFVIYADGRKSWVQDGLATSLSPPWVRAAISGGRFRFPKGWLCFWFQV